MTDAARQHKNYWLPGFDARAPINRWTHIRKLALLLEIDNGSISETEARAVHHISADELGEWRRRVQDYGADTVKLTKQPWRDREGGDA